MKHALCTTFFLVWATAGQATCYVEYKAKQDDPLALHYGFISLPLPCPDDAQDQTAARLEAAGWTLLTIQSASATPPTQEQQDNAGEHFLRY